MVAYKEIEELPKPESLGMLNQLRSAYYDLSDMLKSEHRSNNDEASTGLILVDAHNQRRVFFVYVSLLNMPTAVREYQLKGLNVKYYVPRIKLSSFERAIGIFRKTRDVDEVRDFLTLPLQEQDKINYRGVR